MRIFKRHHLIPTFIVVASFLSACTSKNENRFVVAANGSGDFKTIQEAVNAIPVTGKVFTVFIKSGTYKEKIVINEYFNKIRFIGEDARNTIITYDDYSGKGDINTFTSYTIKVLGSDLRFENLTIQNSEGLRGQAVALHVEGDRCVFKNCRIVGNQDTLYANGKKSRQYFKNCHIEGTTDFIFGSATAVFDHCEILCKKHSYITAASTTKSQEFGYVFMRCKINAAPGITKVYLGRPWRDYANVVYLNCKLGAHICPEGWHNWSKPEREETVYYAEFDNTGDGADLSHRVPWANQLTAEEAEKYTIENILTLSEWVLK